MKFILAVLLVASSISASATINLTTKNTALFKGEVNEDSTNLAANKLMKLVQQRGKQNYPIYLVMDSPGGSIDAGEDFIQLVKTIPNLHTITMFAASMASAIVQALPGTRYTVENGVYMYHRAKGQVGGQFETGELETRLALYKNIVRQMERRNANRLRMSLSVYKKKVKDEMWHYGYDAVIQNSADEVVDITCSKQLLEASDTMLLDLGLLQIKVSYSSCPLLKGMAPTKDNSDEAIKLYEKYKSMKNEILKVTR